MQYISFSLFLLLLLLPRAHLIRSIHFSTLQIIAITIILICSVWLFFVCHAFFLYHKNAIIDEPCRMLECISVFRVWRRRKTHRNCEENPIVAKHCHHRRQKFFNATIYVLLCVTEIFTVQLCIWFFFHSPYGMSTCRMVHFDIEILCVSLAALQLIAHIYFRRNAAHTLTPYSVFCCDFRCNKCNSLCTRQSAQSNQCCVHVSVSLKTLKAGASSRVKCGLDFGIWFIYVTVERAHNDFMAHAVFQV